MLRVRAGREGCGAAVLRVQEQPLLGTGSGRQQEVSRAVGAGGNGQVPLGASPEGAWAAGWAGA